MFFSKQKTAYEMRISDWSSDVCSSDLYRQYRDRAGDAPADNKAVASADAKRADAPPAKPRMLGSIAFQPCTLPSQMGAPGVEAQCGSLSVAENPAEPEARRIELNIAWLPADERSEEHTSELQSLMRHSYAVFCLKKKKKR